LGGQVIDRYGGSADSRSVAAHRAHRPTCFVRDRDDGYRLDVWLEHERDGHGHQRRERVGCLAFAIRIAAIRQHRGVEFEAAGFALGGGRERSEEGSECASGLCLCAGCVPSSRRCFGGRQEHVHGSLDYETHYICILKTSW
jgi:hypothetical protein